MAHQRRPSSYREQGCSRGNTVAGEVVRAGILVNALRLRHGHASQRKLPYRKPTMPPRAKVERSSKSCSWPRQRAGSPAAGWCRCMGGRSALRCNLFSQTGAPECWLLKVDHQVSHCLILSGITLKFCVSTSSARATQSPAGTTSRAGVFTSLVIALAATTACCCAYASWFFSMCSRS